MIRTATAAGHEIMAIYRTDFRTWTKDDASPLTEADVRADRIICNALKSAYPDIPILSEESVSVIDPAVQELFLVDPLDGTKEFLKRNDEFTVNIALIQAGHPVAGVVFAPALDLLYFAATGLGAWCRNPHTEKPLRVPHYCKGQTLRIIGSRSHAGGEMDAWFRQLKVPYDFLAAGSSLKFCRIAEGMADIYPRFGPTSQWDTAAGQCVLETAGGIVMNTSGAPIHYGLDRPLLNPYFFACGQGVAEFCFT